MGVTTEKCPPFTPAQTVRSGSLPAIVRWLLALACSAMNAAAGALLSAQLAGTGTTTGSAVCSTCRITPLATRRMVASARSRFRLKMDGQGMLKSRQSAADTRGFWPGAVP